MRVIIAGGRERVIIDLIIEIVDFFATLFSRRKRREKKANKAESLKRRTPDKDSFDSTGSAS